MACLDVVVNSRCFTGILFLVAFPFFSLASFSVISRFQDVLIMVYTLLLPFQGPLSTAIQLLLREVHPTMAGKSLKDATPAVCVFFIVYFLFLFFIFIFHFYFYFYFLFLFFILYVSVCFVLLALRLDGLFVLEGLQ